MTHHYLRWWVTFGSCNSIIAYIGTGMGGNCCPQGTAMNNNINIYTPPFWTTSKWTLNNCRRQWMPWCFGQSSKGSNSKSQKHAFLYRWFFSHLGYLGSLGKRELSHMGLPLIHPMFKVEGFNAFQMWFGPSKYTSLKTTLRNATPNWKWRHHLKFSI